MRDGVQARPIVEGLEHRRLMAADLGLYRQTNLVSNQPGVAELTDPVVVNAWGISFGPTTPFWLSDNGTGLSTLYTGDAGDGSGAFAKVGVTVSIPGGRPTGQVFNSTPAAAGDFAVTGVRPNFIFASQSGVISGWAGAFGAVAPARVGFDSSGAASYTGLALGSVGTSNFLYAADFRNGDIEVFDRTYTPTTPAGGFADDQVPADFKPYNVQQIGGQLFVTYARDKDGDLAPDGHSGFVNVFDTSGNLVQRLASRGHLDQPWGVTVAPATGFGPFGGAVLVANHGNGRISAFDRTTGDFLGQLRDEGGSPIHIDGLYGLAFGNGTSGATDALYFTAGPDDGANGLFGALRASSIGVPGSQAASGASGGVSTSAAGGFASELLEELTAG